MIGPPGSGKTMLARRMPAILPPFTFEEALETTKIHSVAKVLDSRTGLVGVRPFRSPHHTISDAGLIGGGMIPRPGKVSLAHNGGLFLDELPEFPRNVLEVMRQPLEDGTVCIRTGRGVAYLSVAVHAPHCKEPLPLPRVPQRPNPGMPLPAALIQRYIQRFRAPLWTSIDIQIDVPAVNYKEMRSTSLPENSAQPRFAIESCAPGRPSWSASPAADRGPTRTRKSLRGRFDPPRAECGLRTPVGMGHDPAGTERPRSRPHPESRPDHRRPGIGRPARAQTHC